MYKYSDLKKEFEILTWQWDELYGEHEEIKKLTEEKIKANIFSKERGLHRQDLFYPDEDEDEYGDNNNDEKRNNKNINSNFFKSQEEDDDDDEEGEEDEK